jgi:hypothetical protein
VTGWFEGLEFCLATGFNAVAGEDGFSAEDGGFGFNAVDGADGFSADGGAFGFSADAGAFGFIADAGAVGFSADAGAAGFNALVCCFETGLVPGLTMGLAGGVKVGGETVSSDFWLSPLFDDFLENLENMDLDVLLSEGTGFNFTSWKDDSCCFPLLGGALIATF